MKRQVAHPHKQQIQL